MELQINNIQKGIILKALNNIDVIYNFSISNKEFKDSHNISKIDLKQQIEDLKNLLK